MGKRTKIELSEKNRKVLEKFVSTGSHSVHLVNRAKIILALDTSNGRRPTRQADVAMLVGISRQAVNDAKKAFLAAEDVSAFLQRKKRETPPVAPTIDGELEAHIIALACSKAPEGASRWSLRLLADKCVELNYVNSLSHMAVSRVLKKHNLSLI